MIKKISTKKNENKKTFFSKTKSGFTILEMLLYVAIISTILFSVASFMQTMLSSRMKNQVIAEVEQQGIQVMQQITQAVRNASSITAPVAGASGASLTVATYGGAQNPTIFDFASNAIRIKEGAGAAIALTSSRVVASGLSFQNLSRSGSAGTVRIQFTLTYSNTLGRNEFNYAKTFYGSADIRK